MITDASTNAKLTKDLKGERVMKKFAKIHHTTKKIKLIAVREECEENKNENRCLNESASELCNEVAERDDTMNEDFNDPMACQKRMNELRKAKEKLNKYEARVNEIDTEWKNRGVEDVTSDDLWSEYEDIMIEGLLLEKWIKAEELDLARTIDKQLGFGLFEGNEVDEKLSDDGDDDFGELVEDEEAEADGEIFEFADETVETEEHEPVKQTKFLYTSKTSLKFAEVTAMIKDLDIVYNECDRDYQYDLVILSSETGEVFAERSIGRLWEIFC